MADYVDKETLTALFKKGRFSDEPTLVVLDIGCAPLCPPEATLQDRDGHIIGSAWQSDLKRILDIAETEGDKDNINPNLPVIQAAHDEMGRQRERVKELKIEAEKDNKTGADILLFPLD